jgi:methylglutaconyl-CoA hydratase
LIDYSAAGGVARVTLNRPEKRNALNPEVISGLEAALSRAAADADVRVVLLRGAGQDFCAGLDLAGMAQTSEEDVLGHFAAARMLAGLYLSIRRHAKPIVAGVHGRAIGGGAGLATACDLIVASESAEFRYPEVDLGFVAAIVLSMLRRQVGEKRAFEIVALAEPLSVSAAQTAGIVNRVLPESEFDAYAAKLASKSASALSLTKDLFYHIDGMSFETAIHAGLYGNALARMTPDARRGFEQFTKKPKPQ